MVQGRHAANRWPVFAAGLVLGVSLGAMSLTAAYEERGSSSGRSTRSSRAQTASDRASDTSIAGKLDQILANQEKILAEFEVIKEELRIIKVRASMQ